MICSDTSCPGGFSLDHWLDMFLNHMWVTQSFWVLISSSGLIDSHSLPTPRGLLGGVSRIIDCSVSPFQFLHGETGIHRDLEAGFRLYSWWVAELGFESRSVLFNWIYLQCQITRLCSKQKSGNRKLHSARNTPIESDIPGVVCHFLFMRPSVMTLGKCVNFLCLCFFTYEVATMTPNLLVYCRHEKAKEPALHHFRAFFLHTI